MSITLYFSHEWNLSPEEASDLQIRLSRRVITTSLPDQIKNIGGVDIGYREDKARAAVVLIEYPTMQIITYTIAEVPCSFPYIPGLLSFREIPAALAALEKLSFLPDVLMVDGQGIAHPRRFGIASHLGVLLDIPTIGCAKSPLIGVYQALGNHAGDTAPLIYGNETLGMAIRTKNGCKPLIISIGHRCDLKGAVRLVLECCRGYRLPEPTRLAHKIASGSLLKTTIPQDPPSIFSASPDT